MELLKKKKEEEEKENCETIMRTRKKELENKKYGEEENKELNKRVK